MSWTPENPHINDSDILAFSKYLAEYAQMENKPKSFYESLQSYFNCFLIDEEIGGKTRSQWISLHEKRFSILKPGTYDLYWYPDSYYDLDGKVQILQECVICDMDSVDVPWGRCGRFIASNPTHSQLEIDKMNLPQFSQDLCCVLER